MREILKGAVATSPPPPSLLRERVNLGYMVLEDSFLTVYGSGRFLDISVYITADPV